MDAIPPVTPMVFVTRLQSAFLLGAPLLAAAPVVLESAVRSVEVVQARLL